MVHVKCEDQIRTPQTNPKNDKEKTLGETKGEGQSLDILGNHFKAFSSWPMSTCTTALDAGGNQGEPNELHRFFFLE